MDTIPTYTQDEIAFWENLSIIRRHLIYTSEIEKKAILRAQKLAVRKDTALEIGCEGGRWSKLLADLGWRLICTDIDQQNLNICQKRIPKASCVLVKPDDSQFPCDTESVELILCVEVPQVLHSDWFIDETSRVLRKGGLVVGVFWNSQSWRGLHGHLRGRENWYWYGSSYSLWRKRLHKKGFTLIHEEGFCWAPFRRMSNSSLVPIATRIERYLGLRKLVSLSPMIVFVAQKD